MTVYSRKFGSLRPRYGKIVDSCVNNWSALSEGAFFDYGSSGHLAASRIHYLFKQFYICFYDDECMTYTQTDKHICAHWKRLERRVCDGGDGDDDDEDDDGGDDGDDGVGQKGILLNASLFAS